MTDEVPVILARMEAKLDATLAKQGEHSATLVHHDRTLVDHGQRIVALETRSQTDESHHDRNISAKAAFWTAVGSICIALTLLVSVWIQHR